MVSLNGTSQPKVLATDKISADGLDILTPHFQVDSKLGLTVRQVDVASEMPSTFDQVEQQFAGCGLAFDIGLDH